MKKAEERILLALRQGLPQGARLLLAVSGGCDSLALAAGCDYWSRQGRFQVQVCHVNHCIRGEAAQADAALVEAFCRQRGLAYSYREVDVPAYLGQRPHLSLEGAARALRYQALFQAAEAAGCGYVVTAHQADDQVETLLLRLLRGGGSAGLGAMAPRRGRLLRPFLGLSRQELEAYCREEGLAYCQDASNEDPRYARNRVRLELLPYLEQRYNPRVRELLWQTAALLQEDEACLQGLAQEQYRLLARQEEAGWSLPAAELGQLPPALAKRLLRQAAQAAGAGELGYKHSQALLQLLGRPGGSRVDLPGFLTAVKRGGRLFFYQERDKEHGY